MSLDVHQSLLALRLGFVPWWTRFDWRYARGPAKMQKMGREDVTLRIAPDFKPAMFVVDTAAVFWPDQAVLAYALDMLPPSPYA